MLLPIWLTAKDKAAQARIDYEKKVAHLEEKKMAQENKETDMGKERYQKDFFNKLDEGENLIILYGEENQKEAKTDELRKMFWWQEAEQNFKVWWKNLEVTKK